MKLLSNIIDLIILGGKIVFWGLILLVMKAYTSVLKFRLWLLGEDIEQLEKELEEDDL